MNNALKDNKDYKTDFYIDITNEVCPLTFVKTKLLIESMQSGQTAGVRLRGREPIENVPRSLKDHGHGILSFKPEDPSQPVDGIHLLIVKKA